MEIGKMMMMMTEMGSRDTGSDEEWEGGRFHYSASIECDKRN